VLRRCVLAMGVLSGLMPAARLTRLSPPKDRRPVRIGRTADHPPPAYRAHPLMQ